MCPRSIIQKTRHCLHVAQQFSWPATVLFKDKMLSNILSQQDLSRWQLSSWKQKNYNLVYLSRWWLFLLISSRSPWVWSPSTSRFDVILRTTSAPAWARQQCHSKLAGFWLDCAMKVSGDVFSSSTMYILPVLAADKTSEPSASSTVALPLLIIFKFRDRY